MDIKDKQWDAELIEMVKKSLPNELAYEIVGVRRLQANTVSDDFMTRWLSLRSTASIDKNKK